MNTIFSLYYFCAVEVFSYLYMQLKPYEKISIGLYGLFAISASVHAQITAPAGACPGTAVPFSSNKPSVTYHWDFNGVSVNQPLLSVVGNVGLPNL